MGQLIVLSWRDIPAQIIVRSGRKSARRELSPRFQIAIDRCAMKTGAVDESDYLDEWKRSKPQPCSDRLEDEAEQAAQNIERDYPEKRLQNLIKQQGRECKMQPPS